MLAWIHRTWANLRNGRLAHGASTVRAGLWIAAVLVYAATTARDVLPADSGEFQLVAAGWGIAHPPGYPLYTVVGAAWVHLFPFGSLPFRLNLLSAVLAATTLVLVAEAVATWAQTLGLSRRRGLLGGVAAAMALGLAATFWAQATTANIRMPTLLFTAWGFLALARLRAAGGDRRREDRALLSLALATGLGVGHHPSLAFVAAGWGVYVLLVAPGLMRAPRRWGAPALAAVVAWAIPQLYLPLRGSMAGVPLDPGGLATWHGFWEHVLARGFGGEMFAYANAYELQLRLPLLPSLFRMQFPVIILLALVGTGLWLLIAHPRLGIALVIPWLVQTAVTITYRAPQTVEYLMPAYVPMALALGLVIARAGPRSAVRWRRLGAYGAVGIALLSLLARVPGHLRDFSVLAADSSVRDRVAPILAHAPEDALVLADWRWATPLWVLQQTEGAGEGVQVTYVVPESGHAYEDVWHAQVEQAGARPLYTTHAYDWDGWTFAPVGGGYRLYPRPLTALPTDLGFTSLDADLGPIRLLGYRWSGAPAPGATLALQLAWTVTDSAPAPPSFATRLWSADGTLLSSADRALTGEWVAGEVHVTEITHQLPVDRCTDTVAATVGVYEVTGTGFNDLGSVTLPALTVACTPTDLPTQRPWPGVVLAGGPFLRGVDFDTQAGGPTTAYLHWCGPGKALSIRQGEAATFVGTLAPGACQTTALPLGTSPALAPDLARLDGTPVRLLSPSLPTPRAGERYIPFGDAMVLVGDEIGTLQSAGAVTTTVTLTWRTAKPLTEDYAMSVRLLAEDGTWLGMHDMQPALSALPTLKWVTRGDRVRDPHPIAASGTPPDRVAVVVYERFRMTPLRSVQGETTILQLP